MTSLADVHPWFQDLFKKLNYFVPRLQALGTIPGLGGSLSFLLPHEVQARLGTLVDLAEAPEINFSDLPQLRRLQRANTNALFDAEAVRPEVMLLAGAGSLNNRTLLCTVAGGSVSNLALNYDIRLCIILITKMGTAFRLAYGNSEHGTVPSRDISCHVVAHAANAQEKDCNEKEQESVVLHLHPQSLIELTRLSEITDDGSFNSVLYAQRLEMNDAIPERIGFLPFTKPGSEEAVKHITSALKRYRSAVLTHHGITLRGCDVEECVARVEQVESASRAALIGRILRKTDNSLSDIDCDKGTLRLMQIPDIPSVEDESIGNKEALPLRFGDNQRETTKEVIETMLSSRKKVTVLHWIITVPILGILLIGIVGMTMPGLTVSQAALFFVLQIILFAGGIKIWSVAENKSPWAVD